METESSLLINNSKEEIQVMDDRISALPDDVLLGILQFLDLHTSVRMGALARRWRCLPRLLPNLVIDVTDVIPHRKDFSPHTVDHIMMTYADVTRWFLAPTEQRSIRSLRLTFYLVDPYLRSISHAIVESGGNALECLEFTILTAVDDGTINYGKRDLFTQWFMSFFKACPVVFGWLTSLTLQNLHFSGSDISYLLNTCDRLELLSLHHCGTHCSILEIDAPSSELLALEFHACYSDRVELIRLPKLERLLCDFKAVWWMFPVRFGYVPCLHDINLSTVQLYYYHENPRLLSPVFSNLRDIYLCDLKTHKMVWTLSVLEAAPFLKNLSFKIEYPDIYDLEMANVAGETPMFEHHNLSLLEMKGYDLRGDIEVMQYIRLVRERAVCLKRIRLLEQCRYFQSQGISCGCQVDEPKKDLLKKILTIGFSSSVEITIDQSMT